MSAPQRHALITTELRDKVHLAHLWPLEGAQAHLWGYSPYLNVLNPGHRRGFDAVPKRVVSWDYKWGTKDTTNYTERHLRPFFLDPPPTCPYRPLISYKIGQMPTVTRGG